MPTAQTVPCHDTLGDLITSPGFASHATDLTLRDNKARSARRKTARRTKTGVRSSPEASSLYDRRPEYGACPTAGKRGPSPMDMGSPSLRLHLPDVFNSRPGRDAVRHQSVVLLVCVWYEWSMKVAISLPDDLSASADQLAQRLGVSRSALYARAMSELVAKHSGQEVTNRLNQVYANEVSGVPTDLRQAQAQSVAQVEW